MIIGQGIFISAFNVTNMFVSNCLSQKKDNCFLFIKIDYPDFL